MPTNGEFDNKYPCDGCANQNKLENCFKNCEWFQKYTKKEKKCSNSQSRLRKVLKNFLEWL